MAKRRPSELERIVSDAMSYVLIYAPDFPDEDQTTTEAEFDRLLADCKRLWNGIQDVQRRRWLDLIGKELVEARQRYLSGDEHTGRQLLESAQQHFRAWCERKAMSPTFIVDPSGGAVKSE